MIQEAEVTRIVPICTFQAHKDYLTRVLLSPDVKHLATCSADHTAKVWNLDLDYPPAKMAIASAARSKAKSPSITESKPTLCAARKSGRTECTPRRNEVCCAHDVNKTANTHVSVAYDRVGVGIVPVH